MSPAVDLHLLLGFQSAKEANTLYLDMALPVQKTRFIKGFADGLKKILVPVYSLDASNTLVC